MKHEAKRIHYKALSDGAIAVLMRCCGDESTDQWHTFYLGAYVSDQDVKDFLARAKASCEGVHAARERARAIIEKG